MAKLRSAAIVNTMNYNIDDKMKSVPLFLYGIQWAVVMIPSTIILGLVVAKLHYPGDPAAQVFYMQKALFLTGACSIVQVLFGHQLPLVTGPASVWLAGIVAALSAGTSAIYTSVMVSGIVIVLVAASGLLRYLQLFFTPRVLIVITLLIPFTLIPTIILLVFEGDGEYLFKMAFACATMLFIVVANLLLPGVWKSTTLVWAIGLATAFIAVFRGLPEWKNGTSTIAAGSAQWLISFDFNPGVILSFVISGMVLLVNQVGSMEVVGQMLDANNMEKRSRRGILVAGFANMAGGLTGVIGTVDYLTSTGFISATRCASRFPFLPAGVLIILCSLSPELVAHLLALPGLVMGTALFYVMASQLAAGMQILVKKQAITSFYEGLSMAIPLMMTVIVSFLPKAAVAAMPVFLRPVLSNGFVVGVFTSLLLEHVIGAIYKKTGSG